MPIREPTLRQLKQEAQERRNERTGQDTSLIDKWQGFAWTVKESETVGFQRATKKQARLRLALVGPSGSGKTYSALNIAKHLGARVALVDTENESASKYASDFTFDTMSLTSFHPQRYIDAIHEAEGAGYDVLILDSLSHAWMGKDGALELVDRAAKRSQSGNSFNAWREVTPVHNAFVDAMVQCKCHLIVTMRAKTEYVMETDARGKQVPKKIGMAPIQRDGLEYEMDVTADLDLDNNLIVSKTRCASLHGAVIHKPGKELADTLKVWLTDGAPVEVVNTTPVPEKFTPATTTPTPAEEPPTLPTKADKPAPSEDKHPNKTPITTALTKSIYIAGSKAGLDNDAVKEFARGLLGLPELASMYDLGKDQEPYKNVLMALNAKAAGGN